MKPFTFDDAAEIVKQQKPEWSKSSRKNFINGVERAKEYFKPGHDILSIKIADAKSYAAWLKTTAGLSEASAGLYLKVASWCMDTAIELELTDRNPFSRIPKPNGVAEKWHMSREDAEKIAPLLTPEMQTLFALARWAGMRTPSEPRHLTWDCVDWKQRRITFWAPKTKSFRTIPIFPELRPYIEAAWEAAEPGQRLVCPIAVKGGATLGRTLQAVASRVGINPWPSVWHSLRSSRETELLQVWPAHVVAAWIGHTVQVQQQSYATVLPADFQRAAFPVEGAKEGAPSNATGNHGRNEEPARSEEAASVCGR